MTNSEKDIFIRINQARVTFQQRNLNFMEVLFYAYDIVCHVPVQTVQQEHQFEYIHLLIRRP
jgi:hypothetical protein